MTRAGKLAKSQRLKPIPITPMDSRLCREFFRKSLIPVVGRGGVPSRFEPIAASRRHTRLVLVRPSVGLTWGTAMDCCLFPIRRHAHSDPTRSYPIAFAYWSKGDS